jgi:cytoskeletal protein CcmA (bactofilin family)
MRQKLIFFLGLFLLLVMPLSSQAIGKVNQYLYLAEDEVVDGNYYAIGNTVEILGTVNSDLIVIGGNVSINGLVKGDILALAGNLKINGEVDGNIRAVGGIIEINGKVGKNVLLAAGNFFTSTESEINGHLTFAAGNTKIDGIVKGKMDGAGESLVINNLVKGDVNLRISKEGMIVLLPKTSFEKNFYYQSSRNADIREGAQINGETFFQPLGVSANKYISRQYLFNKIIALFSLLIIGLLLLHFFFKKITKIGNLMIEKPLKSLGKGFIYLIITPIVLILLMITIIGLPLALIGGAIYFIILYVCQVFVGLVVGQTVLKYFNVKAKPIMILVVGLVVYEIIIALPYLGGLLRFIAIVWALGAFVEIKRQMLTEERTN